VLDGYFGPMLCQVDYITLPVTPTVHNTECVRINPDRNEKRVEHVQRIHAFSKKPKLIQISHVLGLNILVFVGEFSIHVLGMKMLCRTNELRESRSGSQVMATIVA
jgi:hypothetical protein